MSENVMGGQQFDFSIVDTNMHDEIGETQREPEAQSDITLSFFYRQIPTASGDLFGGVSVFRSFSLMDRASGTESEISPLIPGSSWCGFYNSHFTLHNPADPWNFVSRNSPLSIRLQRRGLPFWCLPQRLSQNRNVCLEMMDKLRPPVALLQTPSTDRKVIADSLGKQSSVSTSTDVIPTVYAFGNMDTSDLSELLTQSRFSVDLENQPVVKSNARYLVSDTRNPNDMLFLVGLTRMGRWGVFVLILGPRYMVAVRRELLQALADGKKDFDPDPPSAGGSSSGTSIGVQ